MFQPRLWSYLMSLWWSSGWTVMSSPRSHFSLVSEVVFSEKAWGPPRPCKVLQAPFRQRGDDILTLHPWRVDDLVTAMAFWLTVSSELWQWKDFVYILGPQVWFTCFHLCSNCCCGEALAGINKWAATVLGSRCNQKRLHCRGNKVGWMELYGHPWK